MLTSTTEFLPEPDVIIIGALQPRDFLTFQEIQILATVSLRKTSMEIAKK